MNVRSQRCRAGGLRRRAQRACRAGREAAAGFSRVRARAVGRNLAARVRVALTRPLRLAARVLLPASGPDIDAALDLAGLERGNLMMEKATGTLQMNGGNLLVGF